MNEIKFLYVFPKSFVNRFQELKIVKIHRFTYVPIVFLAKKLVQLALGLFSQK